MNARGEYGSTRRVWAGAEPPQSPPGYVPPLTYPRVEQSPDAMAVVLLGGVAVVLGMGLLDLVLNVIPRRVRGHADKSDKR